MKHIHSLKHHHLSPNDISASSFSLQYLPNSKTGAVHLKYAYTYRSSHPTEDGSYIFTAPHNNFHALDSHHLSKLHCFCVSHSDHLLSLLLPEHTRVYSCLRSAASLFPLPSDIHRAPFFTSVKSFPDISALACTPPSDTFWSLSQHARSSPCHHQTYCLLSNSFAKNTRFMKVGFLFACFVLYQCSRS